MRDGPARVTEFRLHGRGGQGGVTCAKIVAALHARSGKAVQTFGDYAGERSGAPVRAYTRVSDEPIIHRNKVYEPHHLLVLDPNLLGPDALAGLAPGGTVLVNSPNPPEALGAAFDAFRVATVDATAIARRHRIGTRSVVIVNTTLAGAFARVFGFSFELLEAAFGDLGLERNLAAARDAWDAVRVREPLAGARPASRPAPAGARVIPLEEALEGNPTGLRTGSWRSQTPRYARHAAPCSVQCPAGNDVVGFVQALAREGEEAAAEVLWRTSPLPGVCGRVCPAPCMQACNRKELDGSVNVRALERWISDRAAPPLPIAAPEKDAKRIAVVGGGPAGISAARALALAGQRVTIFDRERKLGGVLRTGIPEYRLPRDVLDREIDRVLALGIETRLGAAVTRGSLEALAREYDAVVVATGLQRLRGVDGEDERLPGVEQGISFLERLNAGGPSKLSGAVVVLGGGNTAMDCARSAVRAGASRVTVVYRRTRAEMPAIADEIEQAEEEGVRFVFLRQPLAFAGDGRLTGVAVAEVELGPPDASGRRSPIVTQRRDLIACDVALLALGQSPDRSVVPAGLANVFFAGDLSTNAGTVAHAIGSGRRVAGEVLRALGRPAPAEHELSMDAAVKPSDVRFEHFERSAPARERHAAASARVRNSLEVCSGLPDAAEAKRCLSCGDCTHCDSCLVYCPEGIIHRSEGAYAVDLDYCKGCGVCVAECPRKAMDMVAA